MIVDVSEIKTLKSCKRKWKFTSRNGYHLTATIPAPALQTGTLFHNCLHKLYLGSTLPDVLAWLEKEMDPANDLVVKPMIKGYAEVVLPNDLERFKTLDIEHKFIIETGIDDLQITGSIDMICLDIDEGAIYGFEHKTASKFRENTYLWMDEQPRLYYKAMIDYVEQYNAHHHTSYTLGGVYINEVRKLLRKFDYRRTLCTYDKEDLENFMSTFLLSCMQCMEETKSGFAAPSPDWLKCGMCDFADVCCTYMYKNVSKETILDEFSEQFKEREFDHLDEKPEINSESAE